MIILRTETTLRVLEARLAPPNREMRTNLPQTWRNAYISCIVICSYIEKYSNILRRSNISTFWRSWNKKIRKNLPPNWQNPSCIFISSYLGKMFPFHEPGHILGFVQYFTCYSRKTCFLGVPKLMTILYKQSTNFDLFSLDNVTVEICPNFYFSLLKNVLASFRSVLNFFCHSNYFSQKINCW